MKPKFHAKTTGYHISIIYRLLSHIVSEKIRPLQLSRGHVSFLVELFNSEKPYLSQDELSNNLEIDKAATARHIKKLIELGWVTQHPDPENRRKNRIQLTEKAEQSRDPFFTLLEETQSTLTEALTTSEQHELNRLMNKIITTTRRKRDENS